MLASIFGIVMSGLALVASPPMAPTPSAPIQDEQSVSERSEQRLADETTNLVVATRDLADYTLLLAIVTSLVAAVSIGQLIMFYRQWAIMRAGARDTAETARAARDSADAARKQAETSEKTFLATTRPWVGVEAITKPVLQQGSAPAVVLTIKNRGSTPAFKLRADFRAGYHDTNAATAARPNPKDQKTHTILLPGDVGRYHPFGACLPLTAESIEDILQRRKKLWIVGEIEYSDSSDALRKTVFGLEYVVRDSDDSSAWINSGAIEAT
jgi:hypothetical protein